MLGTSLGFLGLSMDSNPGTAVREALQPTASVTAGSSPILRTSPATILLVATWLGMGAGYVDLGLMILKNDLAGDNFYRLGTEWPCCKTTEDCAHLLERGARV
jgi:hypothetical protein